ncbi:MAG: hypothetical protein U1E17_18130 [Geminicoccaceae bacterium]
MSRRIAEPAAGGKLREAAADGELTADFMAEIVDQHVERIVGKDFVEHLGRAQRAAGIADQRVRHGAPSLRSWPK